jgi:hypothetical protein
LSVLHEKLVHYMLNPGHQKRFISRPDGGGTNAPKHDQ